MEELQYICDPYTSLQQLELLHINALIVCRPNYLNSSTSIIIQITNNKLMHYSKCDVTMYLLRDLILASFNTYIINNLYVHANKEVDTWPNIFQKSQPYTKARSPSMYIRLHRLQLFIMQLPVCSELAAKFWFIKTYFSV